MLQKEESIEFMVEALTHFYEAAGFEDVYERELKNKSKEEIRAMYLEIC
jgi:hypothetical protein